MRKARFITASTHIVLHNASLCVPLSPRMNYDFVTSAYAWERTRSYSFTCTLHICGTLVHAVSFLIVRVYILINYAFHRSLTSKKSYAYSVESCYQNDHISLMLKFHKNVTFYGSLIQYFAGPFVQFLLIQNLDLKSIRSRKCRMPRALGFHCRDYTGIRFYSRERRYEEIFTVPRERDLFSSEEDSQSSSRKYNLTTPRANESHALFIDCHRSSL